MLKKSNSSHQATKKTSEISLPLIVPLKKTYNFTKKKGKPLLSKWLITKVLPTVKASKILQSFMRMKQAQEKYSLLYLKFFRDENYKIIGKGGVSAPPTFLFICILKFSDNFEIQAKDLITNSTYFVKIQPIDYVFGYIKTHSYRFIIRSIVMHNGTPAFCYKKKSLKSVDINLDNYMIFHKYTEKISLFCAAKRIQRHFRARIIWKEYKKNQKRSTQHYKKVINSCEYRITMNFNKGFARVEVYLAIKPIGKPWLYYRDFIYSQLLERYGEIHPAAILKDLTIENEALILGQKTMKDAYQLQRHKSFTINEIFLREKEILRLVNKGFEVKITVKRYKNCFLDEFYELLCFQNLLEPKRNRGFREISVSIEKASEYTGIPELWVHPIANYIGKQCLSIDTYCFSFNFFEKKLNINDVASKIQREFRKRKRYIKKKR